MSNVECLEELADQAAVNFLARNKPVLPGEEQDAVFAIIGETHNLAENSGFFDKDDK